MLWAVQHEWPSGARFTFNCYCHWATLVISAVDGIGHFLYIKEGVTQVYPLEMGAYGLGILPLIRKLRMAYPRVTQPWYADYVGVGGTFGGVRCHLDDLMVIGPLRGYFLDPTKSILVVSPQNVPQTEAFLRGYGLHIATGVHYLGVFVGAKAAQDCWFGYKVEGCQESVATLDGVARWHPQTA